MPEAALSDRLAQVRDTVARAQSGAWTHPVRIVAVTKTHGAEAVRDAAGAGLTAVGENRVQEALPKQDACADVPVEWHLIGRLQRNKVRHALGRFAMVHSIDRPELVDEFARRGEGAVQDVLVQVNCSAEPQKGGVEPDGLSALLDAVRGCGQLACRGLMTLAAFDADEREQRRTFALLRELRDNARRGGHELPELSMGMSDDYPAAVREGATLLRLGTVLFGRRT